MVVHWGMDNEAYPSIADACVAVALLVAVAESVLGRGQVADTDDVDTMAGATLVARDLIALLDSMGERYGAGTPLARMF